MEQIHTDNASFITSEIEWFTNVLNSRIALYFEQESAIENIYEILPPDSTKRGLGYAAFLEEYNLSFEERLVLILALIPHVKPEIIDTFFIQNSNFDRPFTEFGGWKGERHGGFLPTGETVVYILAGGDLTKRFQVEAMFRQNHLFQREGIIRLRSSSNEPFLSGALELSQRWLQKLTIGDESAPPYGPTFPAQPITTKLEWEDLVLTPDVMDDIDNLITWINHEEKILKDWQFEKYIKPGFRILFYGPPGTGKTLTATLIGKTVGAEVYRVDLSMVVSKYIGETEKNLANIFDCAESRNWILFFDEADALFGKRTETNSSNDRHSNQEVAYLLQRIEEYAGVIILATNLQGNLDGAFSRRFQSSIYFPMPDVEQRLKLWQNMLNHTPDLDTSSLALEEIASRYQVAGGTIINALRYAVIQTLKYQKDGIDMADISAGLRKELLKEGKTV